MDGFIGIILIGVLANQRVNGMSAGLKQFSIQLIVA